MATIPPITITIEGLDEFEEQLAEAKEVLANRSPLMQVPRFTFTPLRLVVVGKEVGRIIPTQCTPSRNAITGRSPMLTHEEFDSWFEESIEVENWPRRELAEIER